MHGTLRTTEREYPVPPHIVRVVIAKLIELAPGCGSGPMEHCADRSVGERCASALAFLLRVLRCDTEDEVGDCAHEEIKRFWGASKDADTGAREVYLNLVTLQDYINNFFGLFAEYFLCAEHKDIAEAQDDMADAYATLDHGEPGEGDSSVTITETQLNAASLFGKPNITHQ